MEDNKMKKILGLIALLSVMFLLVACGSEVVEDNVEEVVEVEETNTAVVATGEVYQVAIENSQFMPIDLDLKVGDTIEWVNKDSTAHTVTFENGDFDEKLPIGTTSLTHTFTEAGQYRYFCQFHPGMQGSVIVS